MWFHFLYVINFFLFVFAIENDVFAAANVRKVIRSKVENTFLFIVEEPLVTKIVRFYPETNSYKVLQAYPELTKQSNVFVAPVGVRSIQEREDGSIFSVRELSQLGEQLYFRNR